MSFIRNRMEFKLSFFGCAELGRMHIHGGKPPFPDIERF